MKAQLKPFFSIIIPVFNGSSSISATIESILAQSYDRYEIVFIDGGSSDATLQIINNFRQANSQTQVKLLSEPDKGIYDAMNKGIGMASGDWLYFMGSDDRFCDADVLQVIQKEIATGPADLIYGNVEGVSSKTRYVYDCRASVLSRGIHHQSIFYRHSLFDDLGKYDLAFSVAADYDFTLKVFFKPIYKIIYFNRDIAYFGEAGFSAINFDYKFFSGHYRLMQLNNALDEIEDRAKCLSDSIYCCYYLAAREKERATGWRNLFFYILRTKPATLSFRISIFLNMFKRTIRRPLVL